MVGRAPGVILVTCLWAHLDSPTFWKAHCIVGVLAIKCVQDYEDRLDLLLST